MEGIFVFAVVFDLLIWITLIPFFFKKFKKVNLKFDKVVLLFLILHFVSLFLIFAQFLFANQGGVIFKPLFYIPGIGIYLFLISLLALIYFAYKNRGSKITTIYLMIFSLIMLLGNIILLSEPIGYFLKMATIFIYLANPIRMPIEKDNRLFMETLSFSTTGKTEIYDRGWYYEKGKFFEDEERK